jgi:2-polyprenyl-6-methoxyphenol hydroxylase-like FAD-dependent oxidoreductase
VRGLEDLPPDAVAHVLRATFDGAGWETPRVLAGLDDGAWYFDTIGQVRAATWSRGRVVLLGDAAWAPSPVSGMGTSLALVGAYVLGGELAAGPHDRAFARYEELLRPYVAKAQDLPPGTPRLAHPRTRTGVTAFNAGMRVAARLSRLGGRFSSPPADGIELPAY